MKKTKGQQGVNNERILVINTGELGYRQGKKEVNLRENARGSLMKLGDDWGVGGKCESSVPPRSR